MTAIQHQVVEELTARMNSLRDRVKRDYGEQALNDVNVKWEKITNTLQELEKGNAVYGNDTRSAIEAEIEAVEQIFLS